MDFSLYKEQAIEFIKPYYEKVQDFFLDMTFDLAHDYIFLRPHFPFFYILQAIYICYIIRLRSPKTPPQRSFLTAGGMILLGRILSAYFTQRPPILFNNVFYAPTFTAIWLLMNYFPFDLLFKIISFGPFHFFLQIIYSLIQVRESCHGVDIGLRAFPASPVGAILLSSILASTECVIWLLYNNGTRNFSTSVIVKNLAISIIYFIILNYSELFSDFIPTEREPVKIFIFIANAVIALLNIIFCGLSSSRFLL